MDLEDEWGRRLSEPEFRLKERSNSREWMASSSTRLRWCPGRSSLDLLTFGLPIIAVGDHGQLEPITDEKEEVVLRSKDGKRERVPPFNLMANPDITLETIHRNAGEIAWFAEHVRKGRDPLDWIRDPRCSGDKVRFHAKEDLESSPAQH